MGKASSAKKVARAARAGGNRRPGQRRALGFPLLIIAVVVLGTSLVLFARSSRDANAAPLSQANEDFDHWHAAYGISFCGEFQYATEGQFLVDGPQGDVAGIHTHGDGVIHIHPFLDSAGGRNARMRLFFEDVAMEVSDSKVEFPDGEVWDESEDTCTVDGEEKKGQIVVARWQDSQDAADGEKPSEVITEDFGDIRFRNDREYYTIAFVPEGELEDVPVRPDIIADLNTLEDVPPDQNIEAPPDSVSSTTVAGQTEDTSSTTVAGDTSSTTTAAADEATTTTAAPEG